MAKYKVGDEVLAKIPRRDDLQRLIVTRVGRRWLTVRPAETRMLERRYDMATGEGEISYHARLTTMDEEAARLRLHLVTQALAGRYVRMPYSLQERLGAERLERMLAIVEEADQ